MATHLRRSFSILLTLLLSLTSLTALSAPAPQVPPTASGSEQTAAHTMPPGLMSASLKASSEPSAAPEGQTLRYDHRRAWDAAGAPLESSLAYAPGQVRVRANDQGAAYPLGTELVIWPEQKIFIPEIFIPGGGSEDYFGDSVALSGDTAVVGAPGHDVGANSAQGSVYVFTRTGTTWSLQQNLIASDGEAGDFFGGSVALSGDVALVGASGDDVLYRDQGSAYVFIRSGTTWSQQAQLTSSDGASGDGFGLSVALSGDTALVGAPRDNRGGYPDLGAAYVFTRSGTTWSQQQKLLGASPSEPIWMDGWAEVRFGVSVALADDTALVGAAEEDVEGKFNQGSAYVFTRSGATWNRQQRLTASDGRGDDYFGHSVALSGDTALVGAYRDDVGGQANQGSAYVFTRSGTTWSQQKKLTASDGAARDRFGYSVALSADTALVGAACDDSYKGSAYVFVRSGITWSEQKKLTALDGAAGDEYGGAVALAGDTALVGAPYEDVGAYYDRGSARVFARSDTNWDLQQRLTSPDAVVGDRFGSSVALSGDTALMGAPYHDVAFSVDQGSAYVFTRSETTWSLQEKLTAPDGAANDQFGCAVALSGDIALVGACSDDVGANSHQGSAYVFTRSGTAWSFQQQVTAPDGSAGDQFGLSVALSGDTALVGAPYDDGSAEDQGSVYVFTRSGSTWSMEQKLTAPDGAAHDRFGSAAALWGETALVGAPQDVPGATDQGSAYVFTRSGTSWSLEQQLPSSHGAVGDGFGLSVALSDDTALVGASGEDVDAKTGQGVGYVFTRAGTSWTEQQRLVASDGAAGDGFGHSVAVSGDMALVGASGDDVACLDQGSAYVYTRAGTTWTEDRRLFASDGACRDGFGGSAALWGDTALVGAPYDNTGEHRNQGSAYFHRRVSFVVAFKNHLPLVLRNRP